MCISGETIPSRSSAIPSNGSGCPISAVDPSKIKAIVLSDRGDRPSGEAKPDRMGDLDRRASPRFLQAGDRRRTVGRAPASDGTRDRGSRGPGDAEDRGERVHELSFSNCPSSPIPSWRSWRRGRSTGFRGLPSGSPPRRGRGSETDIDRYKSCMVLRPVTICNAPK